MIGHDAERVRAAVASTGVQFVEQTEQRGTGHAIQISAASDCGLRKSDGALGGCAADRPETILSCADFHREQKAAMTV